MNVHRMRKKMLRGWKNGICGNGTDPLNTVEMVRWFPEFAKEYAIKSVADVGAGDLAWFPRDAVDEYSAFDLVPRHPDVTEFNCVDTTLPRAFDVIVCRYVLNHIPHDLAAKALRRFKESGSTFLIMSMFDKQEAYWTEEGMYPIDGLVAIYGDDEFRREKRMEVYKLND
jgi:hypothetical protein